MQKLNLNPKGIDGLRTFDLSQKGAYSLNLRSIRNRLLRRKEIADDEATELVGRLKDAFDYFERHGARFVKEDNKVMAYSIAFCYAERAFYWRDSDEYVARLESRIQNKNAGSNLMAFERECLPEENPRMDKRPVAYSFRQVERFFGIMDVLASTGVPFYPKVATLDMGSHLETLPLLFGEKYYYMTYAKRKEHIDQLLVKYPRIIALQPFTQENCIAVAYHLAGTEMLNGPEESKRDLTGEDLPKIEKCFASALEIAPEYPDAMEGLAYAYRLGGNRRKTELYQKANALREKYENEFAKQFLPD